MNVIRSCTLFAVSTAVICAGTAKAQYTLTTLATFDGTNGAAPSGELLADANGNLYGTTSHGGASGLGTVFVIAADTHELSTLATFNGTNGSGPNGNLLADVNGSLYGTTTNGGASNNGTVFELAAGTHAIITLATFNGTNGRAPEAGLIADADGNLYGTTFGDFATPGHPITNTAGTVFEVAAGTHTLSNLATFNGSNGAEPQGPLLADASGNLYGTTEQGGAHGTGIVFQVAAGTHTLSTLVTFNSTVAIVSNGADPQSGLIADASGTLYGTTELGGANGDGTVFQVAAGTRALTILASLDVGSFPHAGVIADADGNLYGTTTYGGPNGLEGNGTVFEVAAGTHALTTLFVFNGTNGSLPYGGLIADAYGNLYGTTMNGGTNGVGTVFELSPVPVSTFLSGDFNRNGHVTAADIPAMLAALMDLRAYETANGLTDPQLLAIGDVNSDGELNNADLQALLNLLKSGGSVAAVPEPSSLALGLSALGGLSLLGHKKMRACRV